MNGILTLERVPGQHKWGTFLDSDGSPSRDGRLNILYFRWVMTERIVTRSDERVDRHLVYILGGSFGRSIPIIPFCQENPRAWLDAKLRHILVPAKGKYAGRMYSIQRPARALALHHLGRVKQALEDIRKRPVRASGRVKTRPKTLAKFLDVPYTAPMTLYDVFALYVHTALDRLDQVCRAMGHQNWKRTQKILDEQWLARRPLSPKHVAQLARLHAAGAVREAKDRAKRLVNTNVFIPCA